MDARAGDPVRAYQDCFRLTELHVSYYLCATPHAYGAEAVLGAATVLVAAIHTTGRQSSLQAAFRNQYME